MSKNKELKKYADEQIGNFLLNNGFKKVADLSYSNDKCTVTIEKDYDYYSIETEEGFMYSENLNIYWLIGVLTYKELMDKNFNIPK